MRRVFLMILLVSGMAVAVPDNLLSLQVYTQSDSILDEPAQADLRGIVGQLRARGEARDVLLKIGLELADKAVRDYAHLRSLQTDLGALATQPFAREASGIAPDHFAPLDSKLDGLRTRLDSARPNFDHPDRPLTNQEIDTLIDGHLDYMVGISEGSPFAAWASLEHLLSKPASKWDPLYRRLVESLNKGTELSSDEVRFVKTYGRIRMQLELLD